MKKKTARWKIYLLSLDGRITFAHSALMGIKGCFFKMKTKHVLVYFFSSTRVVKIDCRSV